MPQGQEGYSLKFGPSLDAELRLIQKKAGQFKALPLQPKAVAESIITVKLGSMQL